jgi:hypothetical protein
MLRTVQDWFLCVKEYDGTLIKLSVACHSYVQLSGQRIRTARSIFGFGAGPIYMVGCHFLSKFYFHVNLILS